MDSTTEILLVMAVALIVITVTRLLFSKQHKLNLPPGPAPFPIIGSLHLLGTHPHQSMSNLAQQYGPLMSIRLGRKYVVVATSPEAAKEFLKLQDSNFCARDPPRAAELIIPKDMLFSDITPVFRHLRKVFVSQLTSPKRLQASKCVRAEEAAYMLGAISKETGPIRVNTYLHITMSNILSRMILSTGFLGCGDSATSAAEKSEAMEFRHILKEMSSCFSCINPRDFLDVIPEWLDFLGLDARLRKLRARMDLFYTNMVQQHMENRRQNPVSDEEKTLLDVLLEQLDNNQDNSFDITETHIKGFMWDAFLAGTDTTYQTSEWAMAEVLRQPAVLQQARAELDCVVGRNRMVQESDLPELKYMEAIVKETLRLHAPGPLLLPHVSISATKAFGYDIPAKTRLLVNMWSIGRDPGLWENSLAFTPERFLGGGAEASRDFRGQQYEYTPFGSGRRSCPGMALASVSMHLNLASLLHAFDWELPGGLAPEKLDMTEGHGATVPMRNPLVAIAKPRLPSHLY